MIVNVLLIVFVGDDSVYQKTVGNKRDGLWIGKRGGLWIGKHGGLWIGKHDGL